MKKDDLQEIIDRMNEIKDGVDVTLDYGICSNVEFSVGIDAERLFSSWFGDNVNRWPGYSGSYAYPVEGSGWEYFTNRNKWDNTPNGDKRRNLLDWLIKEFTLMLDYEENY